MGSVVALGESHGLEGFVLAGAVFVRVADADDIVTAWDGLDDEVGLVILSQRAAEVLGDRLSSRADILTAVLP